MWRLSWKRCCFSSRFADALQPPRVEPSSMKSLALGSVLCHFCMSSCQLCIIVASGQKTVACLLQLSNSKSGAIGRAAAGLFIVVGTQTLK